jgi:hypothetical protein
MQRRSAIRLVIFVAILGPIGPLAIATTPALASDAQRRLYAVNESPSQRGTILAYDIGAAHRLIKTIGTVPNVADVKGVAASAISAKLYVTYIDAAGTGRIYCLDLYTDKVLWNRAVDPGVDRLAINPNGQLLYVPTWEGRRADYINVLDAGTGAIVRGLHFSNRSHDTQYPLSGPLFQETKAEDGSGRYLYRIDPQSYAVSRIGPYAGILGPYAVDGTSAHVVNDVTGLWGMQVADLQTGRIITAMLPSHPPGSAGLMHGIGWTPDQSEVWQSSSRSDPHVYIWDMSDPMAPVFKDTLNLRSSRGSHWLTFDIEGDYVYVSPEKNSADGTEIFDAHSHAYRGNIGASEDMLEIDFRDGKITGVGDQYGIGRR